MNESIQVLEGQLSQYLLHSSRIYVNISKILQIFSFKNFSWKNSLKSLILFFQQIEILIDLDLFFCGNLIEILFLVDLTKAQRMIICLEFMNSMPYLVTGFVDGAVQFVWPFGHHPQYRWMVDCKTAWADLLWCEGSYFWCNFLTNFEKVVLLFLKFNDLIGYYSLWTNDVLRQSWTCIDNNLLLAVGTLYIFKMSQGFFIFNRVLI